MQLTILILLVNSVFAIEVTNWHPSNLQLCHQERFERAAEMWPGLVHYHAADRVAPRLWVGNVCAAMDRGFLNDNNISLALSVATEWPFRDIHENIVYEHFPGLEDSIYEDEEKVKSIFSTASAYVREFLNNTIREDTNVLIYCNMGVSRSSSVAIHTIMQEYNQVFDHVLKEVKRIRPIVAPNALYRHILSKCNVEEL